MKISFKLYGKRPPPEAPYEERCLLSWNGCYLPTCPLTLSTFSQQEEKKRGMSPPVLEVFYFPGLCYQHFVLVHYNHMSICRNAKILMRIHRVPWKEWLVLIQNKNNVVAGVISWWWLNMWPSCMPKEEHGKYMAQFQLELLT